MSCCRSGLVLRTKETSMISIHQALQLIRVLHPSAFEGGYNLHLGGGILTRGYSENDLDIVAIRRPQVLRPFPHMILVAMKELGFNTTERGIISALPCGRHVYKKIPHRRNPILVDLIVLNLPGQQTPFVNRSEAHQTEWNLAHMAELEKAKAKSLPSLERWLSGKRNC